MCHPLLSNFVGDTTVEKSCKELAALVLTLAVKKNKQKSSFGPGITYCIDVKNANLNHDTVPFT
jgi:hypothetical protein